MMINSGSKSINPELWVEKYGDYLYGYAMSKLFSKELAEDMLQETFLAAYKGKERFQGNSSEKTWLVSILKRKIADYYRKKAKDIEHSEHSGSPFIQDRFMHGRWKEEHAPQAWEIEETKLTEDTEFMQVVQKCISLLPVKWKTVFVLKHMDEAANREICDELEISESNLWTILHRARLQLRQCVENLWYHNLV